MDQQHRKRRPIELAWTKPESAKVAAQDVIKAER